MTAELALETLRDVDEVSPPLVGVPNGSHSSFAGVESIARPTAVGKQSVGYLSSSLFLEQCQGSQQWVKITVSGIVAC